MTSGLNKKRQAELLRDWEKGSLEWSRSRYRLSSMRYYAQVRGGMIQRLLSSHYSKNRLLLVDIACGSGVLVDYLSRSENCRLIIGLDFSESMLSLSKMGKNGPGDTKKFFCRASAFELPLKDNCLDVVLSTRFIHLYEDELKRELIKEMR
ncbi:MAG: class I SAM-dependent methyltransferase, partial [Candidatus Aminicenantales bacterium]